LDARTISGYFIGYPTKSKGYMFYYPTHSTRIVETGNVRFIENGETKGSEASRNVEIKEVRVQVPLTSTYTSRIVVPHVVEPHNDKEEKQINDPKINSEHIVEQPQEIVFRRLKDKGNMLFRMIIWFIYKSQNDFGISNDPLSFSEAVNGDNSDK